MGASAAQDLTLMPALTLEVQPLRQSFHAVERSGSGQVFNREDGVLTGQQLGLVLHSPWPAWLTWQQADGLLHYQGHTQIGLPLRTQTQWRRQQWQAGVDSPTLPLMTGWAAGLTARVGVFAGEQWQQRHILPGVWSTALTEDLRWPHLGAQLHLDAALTPQLAFWSRWALHHGPGGHLAVNFHGVADPAQLRPGAGWGQRIELGIQGQLATRLRWRVGVLRQQDRLGDSPSVPYQRGGHTQGSVYYPGAVQLQRGMGLSLLWLAAE